MADVKGLALEFEDEDELAKKKKEAIDVDVDSLFGGPAKSPAGKTPQAGASRPMPSSPQAANANSKNSAAANPNNVRNLNDARAKLPTTAPNSNVRPTNSAPGANVNRPATPNNGAASSQSQQLTTSSEALITGMLSDLQKEVKSLQAQLIEVKIEATKKVAISEYRADFLVDFVAEAKVMDNNITSILNKLSAKYPDGKNELGLVKKHLSDFLLKLDELKKQK